VGQKGQIMLLITEPERKKRILENFSINHDLKYLMEECFMWTLDNTVWLDIGLLQYPQPPKEWLDYEKLSFNDKKKVDEGFFHQLVIKQYLAEKAKVYSHNFAHWSWLKEMSKFFPQDNEHLMIHQKINEKLGDFEHWFSNYSPQQEKAREIFEAEEV
jgi:hypothetical protein